MIIHTKKSFCCFLSAVLVMLIAGVQMPAYVSANAENNDMISVDFETTPDSSLINSKYISTDPDDDSNHVLKFENSGENTNNVIAGITPKTVLANVPEEKTGVLTYEFDLKFPLDNPMENEAKAFYYPIYTRFNDFNGSVTGIFRTSNVLPQTGTNSVDITNKGEWYNVKQIFDYSTKTFTVYAQGKQVGSGFSFAEELAAGKDPINGLYFRAWVPGGFKWYVDNLKISYVEEQPRILTGLSVFDGDDYVDVDGFIYNQYSYTAEVYGDTYGILEGIKDIVRAEFADGFEDAEAEAQVGSEQDGKRRIEITVSKWPYAVFYTIDCIAKPRPYYNGSLKENFNGKTDDTISSFVTKPGSAEIVADDANHGDVLKTESKGTNNLYFNFKGTSMKDVCDADGRLTYEFDYKINDKYQSIEGGNDTPIAFKIGGTAIAYLRWDKITCGSITQKINPSADTADYDWVHVKAVADTNAKKVDVYLNNSSEMFYSASVDGLTKDAMFSGQLHWWCNEKQQSVVYIDNVSIGYVASHPDMVEEISFLGESLPYFEQKVYEYNVNVYEDLYENLSTEDLNVVLTSEFRKNTQINKSIEINGSEKIISVNLKGSPWLCTYRIICRSAMRPAVLAIDSCDIDGYDIHYTGRINNNLDEAIQRRMTLLVHKSDKEALGSGTEYAGIISSSPYGEVNGTVSLYDDESTAKLYSLTVVFNPYGIDAPITREVLYANNAQLDASIEFLKQSDKKAMVYIMNEDYENSISSEDNREVFRKMNVWVDTLINISGESDEVSEKMAKEISDMIENEKSEITKENVGKIVDGSIIAAYLNSKKITAVDVCELLNEYDTDIEKIEISGKSFDEIDAAGQLWVAQNVIDNTPGAGFKNRTEMTDALKTALLLECVNNTVYTKLEGLILDNSGIIGDEKLKKLKNESSSVVRDNAMRTLARNAAASSIKSVDELIEKLEDALDEAKKGEKESGSSGSSGGGSGSAASGKPVSIGQSNIGGAEIKDPTGTNTGLGNNLFSDMAGFEWADEAVRVLAKANIISGVGNNKFEPGRTITREEFVKLLCEAFEINEAGTENHFEDVAAGCWYEKYVSAAVKNGIVSGISDTMFGSGNNITREDMAVMIYRILAFLDKKPAKNSEVENVFADSDEISDYAKEAVAALTGLKILNGVDDNKFAPNAAATRAEAAVIIFRCMDALN